MLTGIINCSLYLATLEEIPHILLQLWLSVIVPDVIPDTGQENQHLLQITNHENFTERLLIWLHNKLTH